MGGDLVAGDADEDDVMGAVGFEVEREVAAVAGGDDAVAKVVA
jgi:hypothetical protein